MIRNPFRDLDHKKLRRSSDVLQTQNDYYKIVNRRIFNFFGDCHLSDFCNEVTDTAGLSCRVRDQEDYAAKLENYSSQQADGYRTPRGEM